MIFEALKEYGEIILSHVVAYILCWADHYFELPQEACN